MNWDIKAKTLIHQLCEEFEQELKRNTLSFVQMEKRDKVKVEDVKIALIDLQKKLASEAIALPSSRFTGQELISSLKVLFDQRKECK